MAERSQNNGCGEGAGLSSAPSDTRSNNGRGFDASAMRAVLAGDARPEIGSAEAVLRDAATGNPDAFEHFETTFCQLQEDGIRRIDGYVLFGSHVDALALFQATREEGIAARISPTPRDARSSCGVALLVSCESARQVWDVAVTRGIPVENMVALPRQINAKRDRYC